MTFNTRKQAEVFYLLLNSTEGVEVGTPYRQGEHWVTDTEIDPPDTDDPNDAAIQQNSVENYIEGAKDAIAAFGAEVNMWYEFLDIGNSYIRDSKVVYESTSGEYTINITTNEDNNPFLTGIADAVNHLVDG